MHTYEITGSGVDIDGWFKYELLRDDGKKTKVGLIRLKYLKKRGQLKGFKKDEMICKEN